MSACRKQSEALDRQLRKEANFGCVICGCPILDNAHVIAVNEDGEFIAENMISLCPTCHSRVHAGNISQELLRESKKNPHNIQMVQDRFIIEAKELVVNLGSTRFVNVHRILVVNDFDIITIDRENNNVNLNVNFFDATNTFVGAIMNNEWKVDTTLTWDIKYKSRHLIIRNEKRNILLEIRLVPGELIIKGRLYYLGDPVRIEDDGVWLGERDMSVGIRNVTTSNVETAFDLHV